MVDFTKAVIEYEGRTLTWVEVASRLRAYDEKGTEAAFSMGYLALAAVPMGDSHVNTGAQEKLEALAEEAGVNYEVLKRRRLVASVVPQVTRVTSVSFSTYRETIDATGENLAKRAEIFALFRTEAATKSKRWTVNAVRPLINRRPVLHTTSEPLAERVAIAPLAERADAYEALHDDPAVRHEVVDRAIRQAEADREQEGSGEPTTSARGHEERMQDVYANDLPTLYDRAANAWLKFMATYDPAQVGETIVSSPHTASVQGYITQARTMRIWLDRFEAALTAANRPRLVAVGSNQEE